MKEEQKLEKAVREMAAALRVLTYDRFTRQNIEAVDPKALEQADAALDAYDEVTQ